MGASPWRWLDSTPPTIGGTFSPLTLATGAGGIVALPSYIAQAVTSDNVGVTSVIQSPAAGSARSAGTTHVTLTAHDAVGNLASTSFDVIVNDGTPPVITCSTNLLVTAAPGANSAVVSYRVTATDNGTMASTNCTPASGSTFPIGTTTVNCTAVDAAGNSNSCSFTVTVQEPTTPADLVALKLSFDGAPVALSPVFSSGVISYTAGVANNYRHAVVTPTSSESGAVIQVRIGGDAFTTVNSGSDSSPLPLYVGTNSIDVKVTAPDGVTIKTYTIVLTRGLGGASLVYFDTFIDGSRTNTATTVGLPQRSLVYWTRGATVTVTNDPEEPTYLGTEALLVTPSTTFGRIFSEFDEVTLAEAGDSILLGA